MSSTKIPEKVAVALWTRAAGRCQYAGCNHPLWRDDLTSTDIRHGLVAHIVGDSPDGPRGDPARSKRLANKIENLMLMCPAHHRLIDVEGRDDHPEPLLLRMKDEHERRIERLTGIGPDLQTQMVVFRAPIDEARGAGERAEMRRAVVASGRYPLPEELALDVIDVPLSERTDGFWETSRQALQQFYAQRVQWRLTGSVPHLSVFGLAPIPLLMVLGKLIDDKVPVDVYQRHRDPPGWRWPEAAAPLDFEVIDPFAVLPVDDVVVVLSISDTVQDADVRAVAPHGAPVYELRIGSPRRDCVRSRDHIRAFGAAWQRVLDRIRAVHRDRSPRIHVLPALPNSLAIELGRVLLPKSHSPLLIYDFNRNLGGFRVAFEL